MQNKINCTLLSTSTSRATVYYCHSLQCIQISGTPTLSSYARAMIQWFFNWMATAEMKKFKSGRRVDRIKTRCGLYVDWCGEARAVKMKVVKVWIRRQICLNNWWFSPVKSYKICWLIFVQLLSEQSYRWFKMKISILVFCGHNWQKI